MVSRKKARGQARRAAKDNKANGSLEAQMQRLTLADSLFSTQQCRHGLELLESQVTTRCEDFFHTFFDRFVESDEKTLNLVSMKESKPQESPTFGRMLQS